MARDKLRYLGFNEINNFEIAASLKTLLAMTLREFSSNLLGEQGIPFSFLNAVHPDVIDGTAGECYHEKGRR